MTFPPDGAARSLCLAAEEAGDLYGRSEIHRHLGFYYFAADPRPQEAMRQLGHSLALREKLGDPRRRAEPARSRSDRTGHRRRASRWE
jgi:hypothetical protein